LEKVVTERSGLLRIRLRDVSGVTVVPFERD